MQEADMGPHKHPAFAKPDGELFKDKNQMFYLVVGKKAFAFDAKWAMIQSYDRFQPMRDKMVPWTKMVKKQTVTKFINALEYEIDMGRTIKGNSAKKDAIKAIAHLTGMGR